MGARRIKAVKGVGEWLVGARIPDWLLMLLSFVLAALAAVLGALAGVPAENSGADWIARVWWLLLLVAVSAALSPAFAWMLDLKRAAERSAQDEYEEQRLAQFRTAVLGAFMPVAAGVSDIAAADPNERGDMEGAICQKVLEAIPRVLGSRDLNRNRATYYRLQESRLDYVSHAGRTWNHPRSGFDEGTRGGKKLIKLVRELKTVRVADIATEPEIKPTEEDSYRCVISCSVFAGSHPLGMLTVDAPEADELTADDEMLMRVLARLLGAALYKTNEMVIASEGTNNMEPQASREIAKES